jgi:hypothetical protein
MKPEQELIWDYLVANALGFTLAKNINTIATSLGFPPKGTNNDDVRNWIRDMVITHGKPIGTCLNGAFIILNDEEREAAASFVEKENRADAVRRNGNYNPL